ncbi:MAG: replication factor C small subunit, partial [Thermocladium sp.]
RRAINALQAASSLSRQVTAETIYKAMGKASPTTLREVIRELLLGDFGKGSRALYRLVKDEGADPLDVIGFAHYDLLSTYSSYKLPEHVKPQLINLISSAHYRIIRGSDSIIQLLGLLSKMRAIISGINIVNQSQS